jgi:hypothetical protein
VARDKYMMQSGQQTDEAQSYYPPTSGLPHSLGKADDNAPTIDDVTDRGLSGDSLAETAPTEPWMIH